MSEQPPGNPFGGMDLGAMLEQAQAMQAQLMQAQAELAETVVEGSAGAVVVSLDGTGELTAVTIRPGAAVPDDEESWADLGDLVVAAYRDAKTQVDQLAAQALGPLAGGDPSGGMDLGGLLGGGELGGPDDASRRPSGF